MRKQRWQDWILVIGGAWLFVAPWVLGTSTDAASSWNAWILAVLVVVAGWWSLARPGDRTPEWLQVLYGAWLFLAPWVLGFSALAAAAWNAWITGAALLILSVWALVELSSTTPAQIERRPEHPVAH